ncbi:MAG: alpha-L-fucosidase, partial [Clostridia bacterium]|nr:alpha-L-fucosidase [Clostridia bacterium]
LIENLLDCRKCNCNFLLNTGLKGNGSVNSMDACILKEIGKWVKANKEFIYEAKACDIKAKNADILQGKSCYYAVIKNVPMSADPNVQRAECEGQVCIEMEIERAEWLDNGEEIEVENGKFDIKPFQYGQSFSIRIAKFNKN